MNIPDSAFMYISIGIVILYIVLIIIGYSKGLLYELTSLLYTAFCVFVSWFLSPIMANLFPIIKLEKIYPDAEILNKLLNIDPLLNVIAYFVLIFLILNILYLVISVMVKALNKIPVIGKFNQLLGGLYGIINATFITFGLSMLLTLPLFSNGQEVRNGTILKYIDNYTKLLMNEIVEKIDGEKLNDLSDGLDIEAAREEFKQWLYDTKIVSKEVEDE